jgi:hypothetical protein
LVIKRSHETLPKVVDGRKPPIHGLWVPDERYLSALSSEDVCNRVSFFLRERSKSDGYQASEALTCGL